MNSKYTYLFIDFLCILFPFIFSFHPRIRFYKQWKYFLFPCLITASLFISWDIIFTHQAVWSFNSKKILGIYFFNLPIEEILFFICIPYACVFTYYVIQKSFNLYFYTKTIIILSYILILILSLIATIYMDRLYTSITFLSLSTIILFLLLKKVKWLLSFYISFLIILIPFFISNGILTGSWIDEPVVLYNEKYNLGIRLGTIPMEDIFYGMLLVLLNVTGFEFFKKKEKLLPSKSIKLF